MLRSHASLTGKRGKTACLQISIYTFMRKSCARIPAEASSFFCTSFSGKHICQSHLTCHAKMKNLPCAFLALITKLYMEDFATLMQGSDLHRVCATTSCMRHGGSGEWLVLLLPQPNLCHFIYCIFVQMTLVRLGLWYRIQNSTEVQYSIIKETNEKEKASPIASQYFIFYFLFCSPLSP